MERYIAQKADEALKAMCGGYSLTGRLRDAQMHFHSISDEHYLRTTPQNVRESIVAFFEMQDRRGSLKSAALAHSAIASVLIEWGRSEARLLSSLKRKRRKTAPTEAGADSCSSR
jgi:hypothetical protein